MCCSTPADLPLLLPAYEARRARRRRTPTAVTPAPGARSWRRPEVTRLADLSAEQWKRSGIAAWLGWLFDGLDMHLYTLVAAPFVAQLLAVERRRTRRSAATAR